MEERNQVGSKPVELTPEMEVEATDEPIIELTDVLEPDTGDSASAEKNNDEIIELKEVVERQSRQKIVELDPTDPEKESGQQDAGAQMQEQQPGPEPGKTGPEPEEDIIELTEIVAPDIATAPTAPDDTAAREPELALDTTEQAPDREPAKAEQSPLPEKPAAGSEPDLAAGLEQEISPEPEPELDLDLEEEQAQTPEKPAVDSEPDLAAGLEQEISPEPEPELDLDLEGEPPETGAQQPATEMPQDDAHQVIDIAQALDKEAETGEDGQEVKIGLEEQPVPEPEENIFDDIAENLGLELEEEPEDSDRQIVDFDQDQMEAALERVIQKQFGPRIEQLIVATIEKAVQTEIERIKRALLDDNGDLG